MTEDAVLQVRALLEDMPPRAVLDALSYPLRCVNVRTGQSAARMQLRALVDEQREDHYRGPVFFKQGSRQIQHKLGHLLRRRVTKCKTIAAMRDVMNGTADFFLKKQQGKLCFPRQMCDLAVGIFLALCDIGELGCDVAKLYYEPRRVVVQLMSGGTWAWDGTTARLRGKETETSRPAKQCLDRGWNWSKGKGPTGRIPFKWKRILEKAFLPQPRGWDSLIHFKPEFMEAFKSLVFCGDTTFIQLLRDAQNALDAVVAPHDALVDDGTPLDAVHDAQNALDMVVAAPMAAPHALVDDGTPLEKEKTSAAIESDLGLQPPANDDVQQSSRKLYPRTHHNLRPRPPGKVSSAAKEKTASRKREREPSKDDDDDDGHIDDRGGPTVIALRERCLRNHANPPPRFAPEISIDNENDAVATLSSLIQHTEHADLSARIHLGLSFTRVCERFQWTNKQLSDRLKCDGYKESMISAHRRLSDAVALFPLLRFCGMSYSRLGSWLKTNLSTLEAQKDAWKLPAAAKKSESRK